MTERRYDNPLGTLAMRGVHNGLTLTVNMAGWFPDLMEGSLTGNTTRQSLSRADATSLSSDPINTAVSIMRSKTGPQHELG